ncbi:N-acetylglutamate synthase, CG3035 family [Corynebacterium caspium]|uniref:N-acetylglutamate synthase, CG3035 family n=1 Tax=Corynebacterium caspium TaxID=234828 RepID=UPI0003732228|nr:GNAT family N-acetyltransferase [Corynebacterium caspium]WKD58670.1 Mycothiol acetyltransferase [Corynebacterium caspium DSM 44850]
MGRFFRSQEVAVGDRVVVRRKLVNFPGKVGDIIGHVEQLHPLVVRPQKVGGWPSTKDPIEVPDSELLIIRRMPPRTIRTSEIRAVEYASAQAFPGLKHQWSSDGQWLFRLGDSITERSNSAIPLGPSAGFVPVPLAEIQEFYDAHQAPVILAIPERLGRAVERLVKNGHWQVGAEIIVMTRPLADTTADPTAVHAELPPGFSYRIDDIPDAAWLELYHFRGQALPTHALELLREKIAGKMAFARIFNPAGETVAITRATITQSPDGQHWLGYSAVEVAPAFRRQGLASALGAQMLRWGAKHGAKSAFLQVQESNTAGIQLYSTLGFIEHHRHRYAHELSR